MQNVTETILNVTDGIKPIAPVAAGLIFVIIGILYMLAKSPQKKESITGWAMNVGIGFAIVYLAIGLVEWFSGMVVGF